MDDVIGQIYSTRNYSQFKKLEHNRSVLKNRKELLVESFKKGEVLNPIVVNKHMEIIDGQGRFEARKELKLPIYYIIDAEKGIDDCRRMNAFNSSWSAKDYLESFSQSGNENYTRLLETIKETQFPLPRVMRFANKGGKNEKVSYLAYEKLIFTEEDKCQVLDLARKADEITEALAYEGRRNDAFYRAVKIMCQTKDFEYKRFLRNCEKCRHRYSQMARLEDELKEFSDIYNFKASRNRLYFEDYMRNKYKTYKEANPFFTGGEDVATLK